jgi:hypothetical protein
MIFHSLFLFGERTTIKNLESTADYEAGMNGFKVTVETINIYG